MLKKKYNKFYYNFLAKRLKMKKKKFIFKTFRLRFSYYKQVLIKKFLAKKSKPRKPIAGASNFFYLTQQRKRYFRTRLFLRNLMKKKEKIISIYLDEKF